MPRAHVSQMTPHEVLDPRSAADYERQRELLWDSLVLLHSDVAVLRRLYRYPRRFVGAARTTLYLIDRNIFENAMVIAHRLWNEPDQRAVSLPSLARIAVAGAGEYASEVRECLNAARPSMKVRDALRRIGRYRHVRLGHIDGRVDVDHPDANLPITLEELEAVSVALTTYYNVLGFSVQASFDIPELHPSAEGQSEVELMMDGIAAQSLFVTMHDKNPELWWHAFRPHLSAREFEFLVELRQRRGLVEMSQPLPS
jgi:hypothetical protein